MNNRTALICLGWLTILTSCAQQSSSSTALMGTWMITGMTPVVLHADTVKAPSDLIKLFVAHGDVKPSEISIKEKDLVLRSSVGDSASLTYTILESKDNRYTLSTSEGEGVFHMRGSDAATLNIAGATYELKR